MKVGIIGCGNIADIYFSNSQKYFNNFEIVACADIKNEAAKNYAELAPYVFPDIDSGQGVQAVCSDFINRMEKLSQKLGIPQRLRDVNIPKEACKFVNL